MAAVRTLGPTEAEVTFVERGRAAVTALMPDQAYAAFRWEPRALQKSSVARTQTLYFTLLDSTVAPLPERFASVVKAWVAIAGGTASRMHQRVFAARHLWAAIAQRLGADAAGAFAWTDLQVADLEATERIMLDRNLGLRTVNKTITTLGDLARVLARAGVAPPISFKPSTKRQGDSNNHRVDSPEERPEGALTQAAIAALADIFQRAEDLTDQLLSAAMVLMIATGRRWNEIVTLPVDPLEVEDVETRDVTGARVRVPVTFLRYHKAKSDRAGGDGRPNFERQPLTEQQAELARMAVERLTRLCATARETARRLEASSPRWRWPLAHRPEWLRRADLVAALDVSSATATDWLRDLGEVDPESPAQKSASRRMTVDALERYMTERQHWDALWTVRRGGGTQPQRASESLLCIRVNELHSEKGTMPLIAQLTHSILGNWLQSKPGNPSVFERFALRYGLRYVEPDGTPVAVTSHMCRRLFVTIGLTAGATLMDMMRWQGREHVGDLKAYDKRSMAEKAALVRDAIKSGRLRGHVAQAYVQLADDVRDEWLEDQVQAMHVTPLGLCVHDFTATPCPRALNCLKSCPDYLHDANDQQQRTQLVQLKRRSEAVLEKLRPEIDAGRVAPSWVEEHTTTITSIDRVLTVPAPLDGAYVRPFADGVSRFQPLVSEV